MNIRVISLERRKDRRENVEKELKGINFSYFDAVDGLNIVLEDDKFTQGMVGVFQSHVSLYKEIAKNNQLTLILEDDIKIANDFKRKLDALVKNLPKTWDLCLIAYNASLGANKTILDEHFCKIKSWWGFHGYLVNKAGAARKILNLIEKDKMYAEIDNQICNYNHIGLLDIIATNRPLIIQNGSKTDVQTKLRK